MTWICLLVSGPLTGVDSTAGSWDVLRTLTLPCPGVWSSCQWRPWLLPVAGASSQAGCSRVDSYIAAQGSKYRHFTGQGRSWVAFSLLPYPNPTRNRLPKSLWEGVLDGKNRGNVRWFSKFLVVYSKGNREISLPEWLQPLCSDFEGTTNVLVCVYTQVRTHTHHAQCFGVRVALGLYLIMVSVCRRVRHITNRL